MKTIAVSGWNAGFQKINFTQKLRQEFDFSLSSAKVACDAVLDGQRLELHVQDSDYLQILTELIKLGAKVEVEDSIMSDAIDSGTR
jgi:hypothetical protein